MQQIWLAVAEVDEGQGKSKKDAWKKAWKKVAWTMALTIVKHIVQS